MWTDQYEWKNINEIDNVCELWNLLIIVIEYYYYYYWRPDNMTNIIIELLLLLLIILLDRRQYYWRLLLSRTILMKTCERNRTVYETNDNIIISE